MPEVIDDGVSGFVVDSEAEAVAAIRRLDDIDGQRVRSIFGRRFTVERMAEGYLAAYHRLGGVRRDAPRLRRTAGDGRSLQAAA